MRNKSYRKKQYSPNVCYGILEGFAQTWKGDLDEDDMARFMEGHYKSCPYYRNGDEYAVVRHQI